MAESNELNKIKKVYGEKFMQMCRSHFSTLLENEGLLYEILSSTFSENCKTLYEDLKNSELEEQFKNYIYSKVDVECPEKRIITEKTPYELLDEAGYNLFECKSQEEIQKFKKYYKLDEELCTFRDDRLNKCVVFWAVKKNAEDIKREDFKKPKREDKYGTSVMGIQFNKEGMCTVSIKNRYNHTVNNPDATYGNDLDRIVPGLAKSFETLLKKEYGLGLNSTNIETFEIPGYTVANDGKYYKYNIEMNGIYYCPGNIIIKNREPEKLENPESQILIDNIILNTKNKTIKFYDSEMTDSFIDAFQNLEEAKIKIEKNKEKGTRVITIQQAQKDSITIEINENNQIIGYKNSLLKRIEDDFLYGNKALNRLELANLEQVGYNFLYNNNGLTSLELPNLKQVGSNFLFYNEGLTRLELPNLEQAGDCFLIYNEGLTRLELPNLKKVGDSFLYYNDGLLHLKLPNLEYAEYGFLYSNQKLTSLDLPNVIQVGSNFLFHNTGLTNIKLQNLKNVGGYFLYSNLELNQLELPNLEYVEECFLAHNKGLTRLKLPNLKQTVHRFIDDNQSITQIELPKLEQVGSFFLCKNEELNQLELPNLKYVGNSFLFYNRALARVNLSNLKEVGSNFLNNNRSITQLELPNLERVGDEFMYWNECLAKIELPNLKQVGDFCLFSNHDLTSIELPSLIQAGVNFLEFNQSLINIELPNIPKLRNKFLDRIEINLRKQEFKNKKIINSQRIAKLDKDTELTTSEIGMAQKINDSFQKEDENKTIKE